MGPLVDRLLAVAAMLTAIRPLVQGVLGPRSHVSWRRALFVGAGGCSATLGVVGLLALRTLALGEPFYVPDWLGIALAFSGGMLGASTVLAGRAPDGMTEDRALRTATQAVAMTLYVAAPFLTLLALGVTRLGRGLFPWTVARARWSQLIEGLVLVALAFVVRDPTLGGLRRLAPQLV